MAKINVFKTECAKCRKQISKLAVQPVTVNNRVYSLCNDCAWDLECWMHQVPLQFGDYMPLEVKDLNVKEAE